MQRDPRFLLATGGIDKVAGYQSVKDEVSRTKSQYRTMEEDNEDELDVAWGDVSGAMSERKAVKKARQEEGGVHQKDGTLRQSPHERMFEEDRTSTHRCEMD